MVKDGSITTITDKKNGTEVITDQNGILARVQADKQNHTAVVDLPSGQAVKLPGGGIVSADGQVTGQCAVGIQSGLGSMETDRVVELPNGMKVKVVPDFSDSYDGFSNGDLSNIVSISTKEGQSIPVDQLFDPRKQNHPPVFQTFAAEDLEVRKILPVGHQPRQGFLSNLNAVESTGDRLNVPDRTADSTLETEFNKDHVQCNFLVPPLLTPRGYSCR